MLLKHIRCRVPAAVRTEFAAGQRAWAAMRAVPGFRGQWGAFVDDTAWILALWADAAAYERFMAEHHDAIAARAAQRGLYEAISVDIFDLVLDMPGACADLPAAVGRAGFARIADCVVRPGREDHVTAMQATVWAPGMKEAPGMLAGGSWRARDGSPRYLVVSLWTDAAAHARYLDDPFPRLRREAAPDDDLDDLQGHRFALDPAWTVGGPG